MELERSGGGGEEGESPVAGLPFGGLLEAMMGGAGGWTHTLEYDEETGRWVEVGPEPAGEPRAQRPAGEAPEQRPRAERRFERSSPRRQAPANPLTTLLGGAMGGANSEFQVQPPEQLVTFADVGGMDALKREVRDTVGLLLEHPDKADRYGIDWNGILLPRRRPSRSRPRSWPRRRAARSIRCRARTS